MGKVSEEGVLLQQSRRPSAKEFTHVDRRQREFGRLGVATEPTRRIGSGRWVEDAQRRSSTDMPREPLRCWRKVGANDRVVGIYQIAVLVIQQRR